MKLLKYISLFFVGAILFSACDRSLEDINNDPTRTSDAPLELLLPETTAQVMFNKGTNPWRVAGILMQQFVGTDAQQLGYNDYVLGEDAFNNYWRTGLYAGSLKSAQVIEDKAAETGSNFYQGVAKIIKANEYATATSMFGEIPLTEALQGIEILQPKYDSQQSVYEAVQALFDAGIVNLQNVAASEVTQGDLINGGDANRWIETAYALKARYAFHLTKRDPNKASQDALNFMGNAFQSAAGQPSFTFGEAQTDNWGLGKFGTDRPNTLGIDDRFAQMMTDRGDPRMGVYMFGETGAWQYHGESTMIWAQDNATIPLISYCELKFIEAEALVRTGASDADASAVLEQALYESFALTGVDPDTAFIEAQSALSGSMDDKIKQIVEEAYFAYYGHAFVQTWVNYRRTGYPALSGSPTASAGLDPSGIVPVRYIYVSSESQSNGTNVQAARDRQNGGLLDASMWAFE